MRFIKEDSTHKGLTEFPDVFVTSTERDKDRYIKSLMDFMSAEAVRQKSENLKTFVKNYLFVKGVLTPEDFYESDYDQVTDFVSDLTQNETLPEDIVHYSIMNQPINTLMGELQNQPDNFFVKAFDEDSQSEVLQFRTETLMEYGRSKIMQKNAMKMVVAGADIESEEGRAQLQEITEKEVQEKLANYTTMAEKWGNRMLEALKVQFNTKELSEDCFSDLLKTGRERLHIYEDSSNTGFSVESLNPKDTFKLSSPDKKYFKDAYVAGICRVMEISEIINRFRLNKEQTDKLIKSRGKSEDGAHHNKIYTTGTTNLYSDMFGDGYAQHMRTLDDDIMDELDSFLGLKSSKMSWYGNKFLVVESYVLGKLQVGKLTYTDADGNTVVDFVDDTYKEGDHPNEISIEWGYVDQWFKGVKIGSELYDYQPVEFIDTCPIIGGDFDPRNSPVKGFIDLMKPFQILYSVCMNQLYRLLQKEKGVLTNVVLRRIPKLDHATHEDALDDWEAIAEERGIIFEDDSPENMGYTGSNTAVTGRIDLSRTSEMQSRYTIAQMVKNECWELVGVNKQRLGGVAASETATGTQAALTQSYSQTAPWFTYHNYVINQFYQALLDAAQYYESKKETSTISLVSGEGENLFISVNQNELKNRDLRVFVTDRSEDHQHLQMMKMQVQNLIQNGLGGYEASKALQSKSIRTLDNVLKKVSEMQEQYKQQQLQVEQDRNEAIREQTQVMSQLETEKMERDDMNKALDRDSKERIAMINTYARQENNTVDSNGNGVPDIMEIARDEREQQKITMQHQQNIKKDQNALRSEMIKQNNLAEKIKWEKEKIKKEEESKEKDREIRRQEMKNNLDIAKRNKN